MKKNVLRVICLIMALCMCFGLVSCAGFAAKDSAAESGSTPAGSGESPFTPPAPDINYSQGLTEEGLWEGVKASDYVTLPEYKGVEMPAEEITPTAEDIQAVKDNLLQPYGTATEIKEGETKSGDTVNIDYVGSVDGVEFTGGNTNGAGSDLTLGSGMFIPGFEDQLVGKKVGETVEVKVTFPDGYKDSTDKDGNTVVLANKEALFVTTINHIKGEMVYPAFDDTFVSEKLQGQYGWKTVAEADKGIEEELTKGNKYNWLMKYLEDNSTVTEIPQIMIDSIVNVNLEGIEASVGMYGMTMEDYLTNSGFADMDAFKAELAKTSESIARQYLVFQAIAEAEGISADEKKMDEMFGDQKQKMLDQYGTGYTNQYVIIQTVTDMLMAEN